MPDVHRCPIRVYYEDTDAAGIVYYANYLKFAERARTEMMRASGASHSEMIDAPSTHRFAVSRCEVDYLKPARLDDLLNVETRVIEVGAAVIDLDQRVLREGELLADLKIRIACLNRKGRPQRLPAAGSCRTLRLSNFRGARLADGPDRTRNAHRAARHCRACRQRAAARSCRSSACSCRPTPSSRS